MARGLKPALSSYRRNTDVLPTVKKGAPRGALSHDQNLIFAVSARVRPGSLMGTTLARPTPSELRDA